MPHKTNQCIDCGVQKPLRPLRRRCATCTDGYLAAQKAANSCVGKFMQAGLMKKAHGFKCLDCGLQATQWEHRDYSRPLDVTPTCRSCNMKKPPAAWGAPVFISIGPKWFK